MRTRPARRLYTEGRHTGLVKAVAEKIGSQGITVVAEILRRVSLAILFGGSTAVVFAAITLVKAAQAQGVPVAQAAEANAPIFIHFSKIALVCGLALLASEGIDFARRNAASRLVIARYIFSLLCVASTMIFAFGIVPPMERLLPAIRSDEKAHQEFHKLHEVSRGVFGATLIFALVSLTIPAFQHSKHPDVDRDQPSSTET